MKIARLSAVLVFVFLVAIAQAWHDTGHMVVAQIAFMHMTPKARAAALRLLAGESGRTASFAMAACWADDTKNRETGPWHYVDTYIGPNGQPATGPEERENVVWAIERFSRELKDGSDAQKSDALKYLLHFVGDIHMPLHCVALVDDRNPRGDAGGNRFPIQSPTGFDPRPRNLHFLWDMGCGLFPETPRPLNAQGRSRIDTFAKDLDRQYGRIAKRSARDLNPDHWRSEGVALCVKSVYRLTPGTVPTNAYLTEGQAASGERVCIAGYRLAALLDKLLS